MRQYQAVKEKVLSSNASSNQLNGRRLLVARASWLAIAVLSTALLVMAIPLRFAQLMVPPLAFESSLAQLGLTSKLFAIYGTVVDVVVVGAFAVVATVVFLRRSDNWMALLVSLMLLTLPLSIIPLTNAYVGSQSGLPPLVSLLRAFSFILIILVFYLFPDGRFVPRWTRTLAVVGVLYATSWLFWPQLAPPAEFADITTPTDMLVALGVISWFATGLFAQIHRYRRVSTPLQRQQTKWIVFGFSVMVASAIVFLIPFMLFPAFRVPGSVNALYVLVGILGLVLSYCLIPLFIGFSILRYRLWDIDLLINKTLVYATLTGTLLLLYFASVVTIQQLFRSLTSQESQFAVVVSTLVIAVLFNPLRHRTQAYIDQRFYRRKYDAQLMLASFSASLREAANADLEHLTGELVRIIEETVQPDMVTIWLQDPGNRIAAEGGNLEVR